VLPWSFATASASLTLAAELGTVFAAARCEVAVSDARSVCVLSNALTERSI
jgi:hypothetical protein